MNGQLTQPTTLLVGGFAATILLGTLLLLLPVSQADPAQATGFMTALFTATSAVCVTGLVVVDTGTHWSGFGQAVIMGLFQLGGFGMMTSATLLGLLVNRQMRLRSRLLLQTETHALSLGDVRSVAKLVFGVTLVVELTVALALGLRWWLAHDVALSEAAWLGLFHAVSAFNNAGFSTYSDSVMGFATDPAILGPLMLAIVIGGLGFPVLHELMLRRRDRVRMSMHVSLTLWGSLILIVLGTVVLFLSERWRPETLGALSLADAWWVALFTSVSARTAGFNAVDIGALGIESLTLHYFLMFVGGGSAGTAGGVKVTTFFVLLLVVWNEVRGNRDVEYGGRRVAESAQRQALSILVLSSAVIVLAMLALLPMTTHPYHQVLFEVISAFATVGLSTGITADLPEAGQFVLVMLMFIGRVGVVTLAVALALNHNRRPYRYPEEKPIVG
ncbi:TrkH family potassium uptake protein [Aquabacterium fontiphilum]|jgi:trk system potassium uptake protein TrkH|uniref:TrkH family potassium uptake protein n=1 Tax=Aquabacterium fontiphilum TaxID=450365 RepID=UPI001378A953|nr:potassium transporter TrkG [Aquabacterium fontiphilum]NBD19916.1 TrkH family potassium uptake protein [Aquabacterium fontiphilum]